MVAADHRIETALRIAANKGHSAFVAKCLLGGGVQGDAAALLIAVSRNDADVLQLLLQAADVSVAWGLKEFMQLPLARLLQHLPQADEDDDGMQLPPLKSSSSSSSSLLLLSSSSSTTTPSHWAATAASPLECLLLDRIAQSCPYTHRQLQRAMTVAAAAGLSEVSGWFSATDGLSHV